MVRVVKTEPDKSVVKEIICREGCGATLEYVPNDIKQRGQSDYTGDMDIIKFIQCPQCSKEVIVSRW